MGGYLLYFQKLSLSLQIENKINTKYMNILELSEQEIVRRNSLNRLREMGIDAYPAEEFVVDAWSEEVKANFSDDEAEPRQVRMAGRVMSRRIMGKASFMELQDSKGRIQVYVNRDELCPDEDKTLYNEVFKKLLDIGDFVGVTGFVFRTQTGEISVHAQELVLLSKSLKPLPVVKEKDGVTYDAWTMRYLHALGHMNQLLAAQADWVIESVCGIPIVHKKRENI